MGQFEKAIEKYSQCISLDSKNSVLFSNRAMAYIKVNNFDSAHKDCLNAISLEPKNIKAHFRLAICLKGLERFDDAASALKTLLKYDPNNEEASNLLKNLKYNTENSAVSKIDEMKVPTPPRYSYEFERDFKYIKGNSETLFKYLIVRN